MPALTLAAVLSVLVAFMALLVPVPRSDVRTLFVPRGHSVQAIAADLANQSVLWHPLVLRASLAIINAGDVQAGEYALTPELNALDLARMLRDGRVILHRLTIPEGLTSHQVAELIRAQQSLTGSLDDVPAEGTILPETWQWTRGDTRADLVARMQKSQHALLTTLWEGRSDALPLATPQEAVILASIVERETGKKPQERARVAGVFLNRLRQGMPLQADPTVIYGLTGGRMPLGRALTRADLARPSPWNTYQNVGLPPTPICNPGRAALEATLRPLVHDELYFVADGSGGHVFAATLEDHQKNVAAWRRVRAQNRAAED